MITHSKYPLWLVAVALMLSAVFTSCIEDGFTTSSSDVLAFNRDTVAFDTVITLQGTATKQMVVYNHSKKQINISSIKVAGLADKGHFHMNVDGIRGDEFKDVEIRGNDSIYIFIEAYIDEMGQDKPILVEDLLEFETNGMKQKVLLSAWGQDVIRINGDTLSSDTRFTADKPYLIYDTLFVAPDVTLTLDAGTTLLFHDKAAIRCKGHMFANGTAEAPITFRGDRLDHIVGEYGFDMMSGQWGGVIFTHPSMENELSHVIMRGSSIGMHCSNNDNDTVNCALKLVNCVLTNSSSTCLVAEDCYVQAIGTEFSDAAMLVTQFSGGKVMMSQCTFANYYLFGTPDLPLLNIYDGSDNRIKAYFDNCIFYGLTDEINMGESDNFIDYIGHFDVYLRSCLFKNEGKNNTQFINCIWEGDPCFLTVRDDQVFDYRLGNDSDAKGKGNRDLCPPEGRYDRYGNDRFAGDGIDLGAYVWTPVPDEWTR